MYDAENTYRGSVPVLRVRGLPTHALVEGGPFPPGFLAAVNALHQAWDYGIPQTDFVDAADQDVAEKTASGDGTADWIDELLRGLPEILGVEDITRVLDRDRRTIYRYLDARLIESDRVYQSGSSPHLIPKVELGEFLRRFPKWRRRSAYLLKRFPVGPEVRKQRKSGDDPSPAGS